MHAFTLKPEPDDPRLTVAGIDHEGPPIETAVVHERPLTLHLNAQEIVTIEVVVRTKRETDYEDKLKKKVRAAGCAQATVFGDLMEQFDQIHLPADAILKSSWPYSQAKQINTAASLYLKAGGDPWLRAVREGPAAALSDG